MTFNQPFLIVTIFSSLFLNDINAQKYGLYHADVKRDCKRVDAHYLYCSIDNELVLIKESGKLGLRNIEIKSDSVFIKKLNDSLYILRPLYCGIYVKLLFVDKNHSAVDSLKVYCLANPFTFSVNVEDIDPNFSKAIIERMTYIRLIPFEQGCLKYSDNFEIISYNLTLARKDSIILVKRFSRNNQIDDIFKKMILKSSMTGDEIVAKDIFLRSQCGEIIKIDKSILLWIR